MKKYLNYFDIFSKKSIIKLFQYININKHIINLINDKYLFYRLFYDLNLIKVKIFKKLYKN